MRICSHFNRRSILMGMAGAVLVPHQVLAQNEAISVIGGAVNVETQSDAGTGGEKFKLDIGALGGVVKAKDQVFYLDPKTEAEFYSNDDGLVSNIVLMAGGVLSLFGEKSGQGVEIKTFNAVGAIRGTTTYFAWQAQENRTYVCCCYGGIDLSNGKGGGQSLNTSYHTAVILPASGGVEAAPYDKPLNHYDDDIVALEQKAGREPRWQLPHGHLNFFAPRPVPLTSS